jgi:hypothetical protein
MSKYVFEFRRNNTPIVVVDTTISLAEKQVASIFESKEELSLQLLSITDVNVNMQEVDKSDE